MKSVFNTQSDGELEQSVLRQLKWGPELVLKDVGVETNDGIVRVSGFVQSYPRKLAVERALSRVSGVRALVNDIEVKPAMERTDAEIARDVVHALLIDPSVPPDRVVVCVQNGCVTLEGLVNGNIPRVSAERCARTTEGVRGLVNNIRLTPPVSAAEVKKEIEEALTLRNAAEAPHISVWENERTVYLYGSVWSTQEREEAERSARSVPGVLDVKDCITVKHRGAQKHVADSHRENPREESRSTPDDG